MKIDVEILIKHKLTISSYLLACFVHEKETDNLVKYVSNCSKFSKKDVKYLIDNEYLVYTGDDKTISLHELYTTSKLEALIKEMNPETGATATIKGDYTTTNKDVWEKPKQDTDKPTEIDELAEKFREVFPANIRPNGKPVKSPLRDVKKQLINFKKEYKEYTDDEIIEAAKQYVDRYRLTNYMYMRTAYYFIHKRGEGSDLAAEIDALRDKGKTSKKIGYGRRVE